MSKKKPEMTALAALFERNAKRAEKALLHANDVLDGRCTRTEIEAALDEDEVHWAAWEEQTDDEKDEDERRVVDEEEVQRCWNAAYYRNEGAMWAWKEAAKVLRAAAKKAG